MVQPSPHDDARAEHHVGLHHHVAAERGVVAEEHRLGAIRVAPPSIARRRRVACTAASATLSCTRSLTPCASPSSTGTTTTR